MIKRFEEISLDAVHDSVVFLDLDGTLVPDGGIDFSQEVKDQVEKLKTLRNDIYLVSNKPVPARNAQAAEILGIKQPFGNFRKPSSKILKNISHEGKKLIVIGDKILIDGIFAKKIGADFIHIERLRDGRESLEVRVLYALDAVATQVLPFISVMRPLHWVKNILVFAPLFFSGALFFEGALMSAMAAFVAFSFAASSVYVLNDIFDREQDRLHPSKNHRPIASGKLSLREALIVFAALFLITCGISLTHPELIPIIFAYLILNLVYSLYLKHVAVLDIILVAFFYLLRLIAGGIVIGIELSPWIILCTFFAALFLIVGKRRSEYALDARRKVLLRYSPESLDVMLIIAAGLSLITYGLYSVLAHDTPLLVYSIIPIVFIVFRILNRMYTHPSEAETPEKMLFKDPFVIGAIILQGMIFFRVFYMSAV